MLHNSYHYRERIQDVLYYPIYKTRATRTTTAVINETKPTILYLSIIIIIYQPNQQNNTTPSNNNNNASNNHINNNNESNSY